jgi:hypothetical protein
VDVTGKSFTKSNYTQEIVDLLNNPDKSTFNAIRQVVADNGIRDFSEIYRALYDNTQSAARIITIAEGMHNSVTSIDKEITFMATISKLLQ